MSNRSPIFRKVAMDRLSSPERLDELMQVTNPSAWLALLALSLLVIASLIWGIVGRIPTKVHGEGILIRGGQLFKVTSVGAGQLTEFKASVGNVVTQGQVVASVYQPQLIDQIASARSQLGELQKQHRDLTEFEAKDTVQEIELMALRQTNHRQLIRDYEEQTIWLKEKMANQEKLVEQGLITKQTLLNTKQSYYSTQQQIENARSELKQIANQEFQLKNDKSQKILASQLRINEIERRLKELENQLEVTSKVLSPHAGRILEVMLKPGDVVTSGTALLNLELAEKDLEAVVYLNPGEGKKVRTGMKIQIIPSTFQKAEYGYMLGRVTFVADFPATRQAMMSVLENEQLVQKMSGAGAPIALYAELARATNTASGFRWSSSAGPASEIHAGTLCTASIIVSEQRPITLVIPAIKRFFGL